ncbi:hypothetical protein [Pseudoblastomonas halimionae]|uniref:Uncharacterized protein n=1 Tax=Alteriqipengyuania halimionae TaxID=1926630 RepID=A0A6I4U3H1_9SPHN|nr:hypothetical protein [Alteriqipengyuania halimionae]MXP09894.1 hypothetical protein [Alteriqipengyuania halimionae]
MRRTLSRLVAFSLLLGSAAIAPASAANPPAEAASAPLSSSDTEADAGTQIEAAALVRDLVAYARAAEDPEALLVAARILENENIVLATADGAPLVIGEVRGEDIPIVEPLTLLAEARAMAEDDPAILRKIIDMIASEDRGFLPQAIVYTHDLKGSGKLVMRARAQGGRPALVRVRGDGDARLEMLVSDESGREVCRSRPDNGARGGDLVCRWTPVATGNYRLELINRDRVWTRTILVSN